MLLSGCRAPGPRVGEPLARTGEEIVVAGQLIHVGAPVVLWTDPGGYDAYRVERRFVPPDQAPWSDDPTERGGLTSPNRYSTRRGVPEAWADHIRGGGWSPAQLRDTVDQFVLHYDVCGTSRTCFRVLHDLRGLSVHFMLDLDGTIYQTLDVKERAWHATIANDRSVGIEIANIGAYPPDDRAPLDEWYATDATGTTRVTIPDRFGDGGLRTPDFVGYPSRSDAVLGTVNGRELVMYDLTDEQYDSLIKLTAALHRALPKIRLDYPRDDEGQLLDRAMTRAEFDAYTGLIGHNHVQANKIDPGPAFDWDRVVNGAQRLLRTGRTPRR